MDRKREEVRREGEGELGERVIRRGRGDRVRKWEEDGGGEEEGER